MSKNDRLEAIKKMYHYDEQIEDVIIIDDEIIDNWYVFGFPNLKDLEAIFFIEDLYDSEYIDAKIYIKDICN